MPVSLVMRTMSLQTSSVGMPACSLRMALSALSRMCCVYSRSVRAVVVFSRTSASSVSCHCQCSRAALASHVASSMQAVKR